MRERLALSVDGGLFAPVPQASVSQGFGRRQRARPGRSLSRLTEGAIHQAADRV